MSAIAGTALTAFGRHEGASALDLMERAAAEAIADAELERGEIDGLIVGYATTLPHLMLSTLLAERMGMRPRYAHAMQLGGATGGAMVMLADMVVRTGEARHVLVVGGENRATGSAPGGTLATLAQVGHEAREVPLGASVPAYYALVASRYLHETGATHDDLAALAVLMRAHAAATPGAHFNKPITEADVLAARPIADPLTLLDCCPVSDGATALVVSDEASSPIRIGGAAQAHTHQHVSEAPDDIAVGAREASARALERAGRAVSDIAYAAIYDSFTVTLALLLEAVGLSDRGRAGHDARTGRYDRDGALPLNTHGGLLSYGHCGVAGAMAHLVEAVRQMNGRVRRESPDRAIRTEPATALWHGDGGVLSSHVSLVLERVR